MGVSERISGRYVTTVLWTEPVLRSPSPKAADYLKQPKYKKNNPEKQLIEIKETESKDKHFQSRQMAPGELHKGLRSTYL